MTVCLSREEGYLGSGACFTALERPRFFGGSGAMVSSAIDYARYAQAMLNGGQLGGARVLAPSTVSKMTTDNLRPGTRVVERMTYENRPSPDSGQGWGLGFNVKTSEVSPRAGAVGTYYWSGVYGPSFWVDPKEQVVGILMIQSPYDETVTSTFRHMVYAALVN